MGSGPQPTLSLWARQVLVEVLIVILRTLRYNPRLLRPNHQSIRSCEALWLKPKRCQNPPRTASWNGLHTNTSNQPDQMIVIWPVATVCFFPLNPEGERHWESYRRAWSFIHIWNEMFLETRARHRHLDIDQFYQKYRPDLSAVDTSSLVRHTRSNQIHKTGIDVNCRGGLDSNGNPW